MNLKNFCGTVATGSTVEDLGHLEYDTVSLGESLPLFQRNVVPLSLRVTRQFFSDLLLFQMKVASSFEMLGTVHQMTHHHIPEDVTP